MSDLGSRPEWMIFLVLGNSKKSFLIVKAVKFDQSCLKNRPPPIFSQWVKNEMVKIVQKSVAFLALGFSEWDFFLTQKIQKSTSIWPPLTEIAIQMFIMLWQNSGLIKKIVQQKMIHIKINRIYLLK